MLNVGSNDDRTTAARIRHAGVELFGANGFDATTIRQIAAHAGVSVGLVNHHFGSKDGLRQACDDWVVEVMSHEKNEVLLAGSLPQLAEHLQANPDIRPVADYLVQSLRAGGEAADRIYDRMVEVTTDFMATGEAAGLIRPSPDGAARNAVVVAYSAGAMLLRSQLSRHLGGADLLDPAVYGRYGLASLDIFTNGVMADTSLLDQLKEQQ